MEIENIPLSGKIIRKIKERDLTLEEYFILVAKFAKYNWLLYYKVDNKVYDKLIEKKYLTNTRSLSSWGKEDVRNIIGIMDTEELIQKRKLFEEFWKAYPDNDAIGKWQKTRNFKTDKDACFQLYLTLLEEYDHNQIIEAVNSEKTQRIRESIYENRLTYMPNPKKWLKEKRFVNYLPTNKEDKSSNNIVSDIL